MNNISLKSSDTAASAIAMLCVLALAAIAHADGTASVSNLPPVHLTAQAGQSARDAAALAAGTGPIRSEPVAGGVGASVDLLQAKAAPGFFARNWGKLASGAGAAGAYALVAKNNGLWPFTKEPESGGIADSGNTRTTTQSDRHDVNVNVTKNTAPVTVIVDQSLGAP